MPQVEYRRDLNKSYMTLTEQDEVDTADYQLRMFMSNTIEGLLPCVIQKVDNKNLFCYDITQGRSLQEHLEGRKAGEGELSLLFEGVVDVLRRLREFLLNPGYLLLEPQYIYFNKEEKWIKFCYLPLRVSDIGISFRELAEYLLAKIDHEDEMAVMLGYGVYRCSMEENFTLEQIEKKLFKKGQEEKKSILPISEEEKNDTIGCHQQGSESLEEFFREEECKAGGAWKVFQKLKEKLPGFVCAKRKRWSFPPKGHTVDLIREESVYLSVPPIQWGKSGLEGIEPLGLPYLSLNKNTLVLGKGGENLDISLPYPTVSKLHCRLRMDANKLFVTDLHSRNGTYLNEKLLIPDEEYEVFPEDKLTFADLVYVYRCNIQEKSV